MKVVNPLDFGASGNGTSEDLPAIKAAIDALPASGGIVYFPSGKSFKKSNVLVITKSHVKLWSTNRGAEVFQSVAGQRGHQATLWRNTQGGGAWGLKLRSDATQRFDALEDNQLSFDKAQLVEVVGNEIQGSAAVGVFLFGSKDQYIEGNYVHHTWADHIHHTDGATNSTVWGNFILNEAPSKGDDGIACVTYGEQSPRCSDMEWFKNTILHQDWGRGYSVIGGNNISIHDNWAVGVAGAGIIVASEAGYSSAASQGISISNNYIRGCGATIGHPNILISGASPTAGALKDIALTSNVSVDGKNGAFREEGSIENVTNNNMLTQVNNLPGATPTPAQVKLEDTTVLRTRDTSSVQPETRGALYRIHVRRNPNGVFEQRFEYIVKGPPEIVSTYVDIRQNADDYLSEQRTVDGTAYALLLTAAPISVPSTLTPVSFKELRDQDRTGKLSWLWARVDSGNY